MKFHVDVDELDAKDWLL